MLGPLVHPTPPSIDGVVDLGPVVDAARLAAGCVMDPYDRDDMYMPWYRAAEDRATALMADWHGVQGGYMSASDGEVVIFAPSPRHCPQARLTLMPRGLWLVEAYVGPQRMTQRGIGVSVHARTAYVDRATALRHAARICLEDFACGREARYTRISARLREAAGEAEPVAR